MATVKQLGEKYEFNVEEALLFLNITEEVKVQVQVKAGKEGKEGKEKVVKEKKEKVVKEKKEKKEGPKMVLPFCGRVVTEWCEGVKLNHGLYSQCVSEKSVSESGEKYCKSCKKQAEANESGKPNLGEISDRLTQSSEAYRAEKGKKCVVYAVVMKKLKITKEEAEAEALKFGLEIPGEEFEMPKSQRGRPKKVSESDSVSSGSAEGEKKGRGRPKKNKTVAENQTDETDDLIASLVAEANALKDAAGEYEAEGSEADDEEEEEEEAEEEADETENKNVLKAIAEKIKADETFNTLYSQVVPKAERKAHLAAIDEHLKTLLTAEEMALYQSASTDEEEAIEAEAEAEEEEEDEATKKAREAAEKKAQAELEKKAKKEQADLEKKAKKEQADLEKKAKADLEKQAKKEQADLEKQAKKEQADLEKQAKKPVEKKPVEKKVAEVKPVEKAASAELQVEVVEESNAATETVNAEVFEFEGKKYLKTNEGILYDQETEESVGVWNEATKSIDEFADDEE